MRVISSRQPCYFPGIPLLQRMLASNIHIISDNVKFSRGDYENRNWIKSANGRQMLTIPVKAHSDTLVSQVEIDNTGMGTPKHWQAKHWRTLELAYQKALYWEEVAPLIHFLYRNEYRSLLQWHCDAYAAILRVLATKPSLMLASSVPQVGTGSQRVLSMCQSLGANVYLAGEGARGYLNLERFDYHNIKVIFSQSKEPIYPQLFGDRIQGLSCLDLLFNCGVTDAAWLLMG
ncbi:MAG: WbqC family protein [Stenomitos frigidus ULC029]